MNLPAIIKQVRYNINDTEISGFPNEQIVMYLNDALKFVRRTVLIERPELVEERVTLKSLNRRIALPKPFVKIRRISRKNNQDIKASTYELRFPNIIDFEDRNLKLEDGEDIDVEYVPEFVEEDGTDKEYPLPNDFSQAIVEYITIRAQSRNEFNMSQEAEIFAGVYQQVVEILRSMRSDTGRIEGYWGIRNGDFKQQTF